MSVKKPAEAPALPESFTAAFGTKSNIYFNEKDGGRLQVRIPNDGKIKFPVVYLRIQAYGGDFECMAAAIIVHLYIKTTHSKPSCIRTQVSVCV